MKHFFVALALAAAVLPLHAADTYVIDNSHTFPKFSYTHLGLSTSEGRFDRTSGSLTLDLAAKTGSVDITIDAASVSTGWAKFDEHLRSPDFFDVAKYPVITFKSSQFTFSGATLTAVTGDLTIHGVTRPATLAVSNFVCKEHPMKKTPACGAHLTTTLKRSEFGVGAYVPAVSDAVELRISVEANGK